MSPFLRLFTGCLVQLAPFALLCFYPFTRHFRYSCPRTALFTAGLLALLGLVFASVSCWLDLHMDDTPTQLMAVNGAFIACLLPCLGWYLYAVQVRWQQKLFVFIFALTSALSITSLQNFFWADSPTRNMPYEYPTLPCLALVTAALLPLLLLLLRTCYLPVAEGMSRRETAAMDGVALLLFVMLACGLIPLDYGRLQDPVLLTLYLILLMSVFVIYAVVFRMLFHAHQHFTAQQALTRMEHQLALNREQYRRITDNIAYSRRIQHDFRHHALVLEGLLQSGKLQEAETYLTQYANSLALPGSGFACDDPIVDALLNYFTQQAKDAGVALTAHVSLPRERAVDDGDMAVLLGNLLENAIRAAASAPPDSRVVQLSILYSGAMLAITVDNGYGQPLSMKDGRYLSTRQRHTGIGMDSIESIARKYGGGVEFAHDAARFHASVMLNTRPPQGGEG